MKFKVKLLACALAGSMANASHAEVSGSGALTVGSFGRHDEVASARFGGENAYVQVDGTRTQSDDYKDGEGNAVHSKYMRWSGNAAFGWTPDDNTVLELSLAKSDGEAVYADRSMDGPKFERDNYGLKFDRENISSLVERIEAQVFYNYIDHVMDDYSLRAPGMSFSAMNPDRKTTGGRIAVTLLFNDSNKATVGLDTQTNTHTGRMVMMAASAAAATAAYLSAARVEDMNFKQTGIFGEATHILNEKARVVAGLRVDFHEANDTRAAATSSTSGQTDRKDLPSYFARYELEREGGNGTSYIGLGHAERTPDYWERLKTDVAGSTRAANSSFFTKPEKTTQLDFGSNWKSGNATASVSAFYGKITDYILIKWANSNLTPLAGDAQARNVSVTTYGGEADVNYRLTDNWKANVALTYVRSTNDTDSLPLAQQPPLEARFGANYDDRKFLFGALLRLVAEQSRFDAGSGNIVFNGMDYGRTSGFGIVSVNGGWRPTKNSLITVGVDNLFDRKYDEALSRGFGAAVAGYTMPANSRISEMGRNFWLKGNIEF